MSQPMTIARVTKEDQWENKYGKNQAYSLDLKLPDGTLEMGVTSNRKLKDDGSHNEPTEGEAIWGDILPDGRGGEKLKLDYDAIKENGSPSSFSGGSSETKASSGKSETDWDAIGAEKRRCHSQEMSIRVLTAMGAFEGKSADRMYDRIESLANWFDTDVITAGKKHGQRASQGAPAPAAVSTAEAQASSPAQSAPPEKSSAVEQDERAHQAEDTFWRAMEAAAPSLEDYKIRWLFDKAYLPLDKSAKGLCIGMLELGDTEAQSKAVNRLWDKAGTKVDAGYLPRGDLPF